MLKMWRSRPCRFFAAEHKWCNKGDACGFSHISDGWDYHTKAWVTHPPKTSTGTKTHGSLTESGDIGVDRPSATAAALEDAREPLKRKRTRPVELVSRTDPTTSTPPSTACTSTPGSRRPPMLLLNDVLGWLAEERGVGDQKAVILEKDLCQHVRSTGEISYHAPYEKIRVVDANNVVLDEFTVDANRDVVWCAMLYGRGEKLQQHLTMCLLLGNELRTQMKPKFQARGISFANVLFVTPDALQEFDLKAVSWFWSIRVVAVPTVSPERLRTLGDHLCDEHLDPAHVFLKVEAFSIQAKVSVISDLDMMILDPEEMESFLSQFITNEKRSKMLDNNGGIALMSRVSSTVSWDTDFLPKRQRRKNANTHASANVSYCFGVIRPNREMADRYKFLMEQKPARQDGRLSDQDLLSEFVGFTYLEMRHNLVMFPSWFNHANIMKDRAHEILSGMRWSRFAAVTPDDIEAFVKRFGAVHFSSAFNPYWDESYSEKLKVLARGPRGVASLGEFNGIHHKFEDYLNHFLGPLWVYLRSLHGKRVIALQTAVARIVGSSNPTPGLSRALVTLTNMIVQNDNLKLVKEE